MKIGVMYGNPETTTGGHALKFYASVRIELRKAELIKNGDTVVGIRSSAKIVKNKVAPPLYKAFVDIYFDKGIDHTSEIIDFALEKSVIEKKGSFYYFEGTKIGQGKEATKDFLVKNADLFDKIQNKVLSENAVEVDQSKKKTE
jgi:recombination protein RecA